MKEWKIELDPSIVESLTESIRQASEIDADDNGRELLFEQTIGYVNGVKVEIFANEHPPPHFRVKYQRSTANFSIRDCTLINGTGQELRYESKIRDWWKDNKQKLIESWNQFRPTDCPVGQYIEN